MASDTVRLNAVLPADVEARFRAAVAARMGMKKGHLSDALAEAMRLWLDAGPPPPRGLRRRLPTRAPARTPQEAAVARMRPIERMSLAYKLSRFARGER